MCRVDVCPGNRRILNGPRKVDSNQLVLDFLKKHCEQPSLDSPGTFVFICKSCFYTVEKVNRGLDSAQQALNSLRHSMELSPARFQINTEHPLPPPVITPPSASLSIAETTASTSSASDEDSEPRNS